MLRPVSTADLPSAGRTSTELVDLLGEGIETVEGDGATRGLFVGDVCYKGEGGSASRKVSFNPRGSIDASARAASASFDTSRKRTLSDFGWYEFDEEGSPACATSPVRGLSSASFADDALLDVYPVGLLTNWHTQEHLSSPDQAAGGAGGGCCVAERSLFFSRNGTDYAVVTGVKILNFLISTRSFLSGPPPPSPGASTPALAAAATPTARGRPLEGKKTCFAWAVPEIRIVARRGTTLTSRHAEYLVAAVYGADVWTSWKRYSDFERLAETLKARKANRPAAGGGGIGGGASNGKTGFAGAVAVWEMLQKQRKWFRCLEPKYLRLKSYYVESFLQELLFQADSHEELLEFFKPEHRDRGAAYGEPTSCGYASDVDITVEADVSASSSNDPTGEEPQGSELTASPGADAGAGGEDGSNTGSSKSGAFGAGSRSSSIASMPRTSPSSAVSLGGDWPSSTAL